MIMKRLKPVSLKATFLDRRGSRRQAISLSLGRQSVGVAAEIPNNSADASLVHGFQVSADTDHVDDFHDQSVLLMKIAEYNKRKWAGIRE